MGLAALGADRRHQRLELVGRAPGGTGDETFASEATGDRAAGRVAGADDEGGAAIRNAQRAATARPAPPGRAARPAAPSTGRCFSRHSGMPPRSQ